MFSSYFISRRRRRCHILLFVHLISIIVFLLDCHIYLNFLPLAVVFDGFSEALEQVHAKLLQTREQMYKSHMT